MIDILLAYQGYNRCYTKGTPCTQRGALLHETAAVNPMLKRYVEAPLHLGVNSAKNWWNRVVTSGAKQVHGFIGLDARGKIAFVQTLPLDVSCWGVGGGKNGSYNYDPSKSKKLQRAHLQVEICRGSKSDANYYWQAISLAERVYAHWCRLYGFDPLAKMDNGKTFQVVSHREAARAGFGSNHGDPDSYMAMYGDTMDKFRQRVKARLEEPAEEVRYRYEYAMPTFYQKPKTYYHGVKLLQECLNQLGYKVSADGYFGAETHDAVMHFREAHGIPTPLDRFGNKKAVSCDAQTWAAINKALNGNVDAPALVTYTGTVQTKNTGYISVWDTPKKVKALAKVYDGKPIAVTGAIVTGYMAPCKAGNVSGYCDTRYLIDRR